MILVGLGAIWIATLKIPSLDAIDSRKISQSTKIYDRTGKILLYDLNKNVKRTVVSLDQISDKVQKATIAIEDSNFYSNSGVEPTAILRALITNLISGETSQGGSTISQQVIKNTLLTKDKTITRKIKEAVLAVKLNKSMSKDKILEIYLNETPYGGTYYGVEEASQAFFGKPAKDVTWAEAAYLSAIPQAPTFYSPFGTHKKELDIRKDLVLSRLHSLKYITDQEYESAKSEKVKFLAKSESNIRAPHFVMYVKDLVAQKYGEENLETGGLRIITTLNADMQQTAEDTINKFSKTLNDNYSASNTAAVAIDPKTGDILVMVGSRDFFDNSIDGNYNIATAKRQPGSTFKPFVYATAFEKGYTPETVLFDIKTEFSSKCLPDGKPKDEKDDPEKVCYSPDEFDNTYPGPMKMREALAQSRNVPAVKTLYLAGIRDSIKTATDMGITSLTDPNRYGLTLVLGGGEVSLLELTSAYGVFANDGIRNPYRAVLRIEDSKGNILEEATTSPSQVIDSDVTRQISDILSDNKVRMNSLKPIGDSIGRPVAIKTGTTNDYRDVWTLGYTPNLVVGMWAGKNDNSAMKHNVAGLIISPVWGAFMAQALKGMPVENFKSPPPPLIDGKPVLRGRWEGGQSFFIDNVSGKLATENTPLETRQEIIARSVHTILHWVNKSDPTGNPPVDPNQDPQYEYWEYSVRKWLEEFKKLNPSFVENNRVIPPTGTDDVHLPEKMPKLTILSPSPAFTLSSSSTNKSLEIKLKIENDIPIKKADVYLNGKLIYTENSSPLSFYLPLPDLRSLDGDNNITVTVSDRVYNKGSSSINFTVTK
jgi:1A family penicillin-binding protein